MRRARAMTAAAAVTVVIALLSGNAAVADRDVRRAPTADEGRAEAIEVHGPMAFYTTPSGSTLALAHTGESSELFYGTGRDLYRQRVLITSTDDDDDVSVLFWAPQHPRDGAIESSGETWSLRCGDKAVPLAPVDADERDVLLASATFRPRRFRRRPYALARNERGEYFYVDRDIDSSGSQGFQMFIGRTAGAADHTLRRQKLRWVVSDSEGDVFATRRGELRIARDDARDEQKSASIEWRPTGKRRSPTPLLAVPIGQNSRLIYNELGVYNQRFGTPCDSPSP